MGGTANVLQALIRYIQFSVEDAQVLGVIRPILRPYFPQIVQHFYEAVFRTPDALAVFRGGEEQIERQRVQLIAWLEGLLGGVYDDAYYDRRARIGRAHVRIALDQRYMFAGMNIVRSGLHGALGECELDRETTKRGHRALDKICDIELAIMLETYREDSNATLKKVERLATVGQVAASIGHELRNPLAVMQTSLILLGRRVPDDPKVRRHLKKLDDQIGLCSAIISDLLELARDRPPDRRPCDLCELAREALLVVPRPEAVEINLSMQPSIESISVDPGQLRQLVINLVLNAVQAVGPVGKVEIRVEERDDGVALCVEDSGPGIPEDVGRRLFEPLFTTRSTGTGLGLALCRRVTEKHGGTITAANRERGGARFVVVLPRSEEVL
ncbi:MAG TPA: histidine kinase [Nannocystis exedens]|nr:histidine kinase [Nannocystis exedens]